MVQLRTDPPVSLSVVICTWNRGDRLDKTLRSLLASEPPSLAEVELLVVDNASTDNTKIVVERFATAGVRYAFEGSAGLSHARNLGVRLSRSQWILFLDDDVEIESDFFSRYLEEIRRNTDYGFFGGPITPHFEGPRRSWTPYVMESHGWVYSCLELGAPSREFGPHQVPFGANLCVRRQLLLQVPFSPDFGYRHGALIPGEETAVINQLRETGVRGKWLYDCAVRHCLPESRNKLMYLLRRAYGQGCSSGSLLLGAGASRRWVYKALATQLLAMPKALFFEPPSAMSALIEMAFLLGILSV